MKLSSELEQTIAESGARLLVGYPWWLRPLLAPGVSGITLGRRIYLHAASENVPDAELERLLRHELAHVRQVARLGLPRFLGRYLGEYLLNLGRGKNSRDAYRAISFELEASAAEKAEGVSPMRRGRPDG